MHAYIVVRSEIEQESLDKCVDSLRLADEVQISH